MNHKVSYILVWSNTKTMHRNDPSCYDVNEKVNKALLKQTLNLIEQILELNPHEILIMDNEGDFPKHQNPLVKVIPSYQSVGYLDGKRPEWLDKINLEDYTEDNEFHAAKSTAMAYNHGLTLTSGDYLILQHNDTKYLFDNYSSRKIIKDCDFFLFSCDFYYKHEIGVDGARGDNNHLATITCFDKGLKYSHLPGWFENYESDKHYFNNTYNFESSAGNLHIFRGRPFLIHLKGGTGLYRVLEENR